MHGLDRNEAGAPSGAEFSKLELIVAGIARTITHALAKRTADFSKTGTDRGLG